MRAPWLQPLVETPLRALFAGDQFQRWTHPAEPTVGSATRLSRL